MRVKTITVSKLQRLNSCTYNLDIKIYALLLRDTSFPGRIHHYAAGVPFEANQFPLPKKTGLPPAALKMLKQLFQYHQRIGGTCSFAPGKHEQRIDIQLGNIGKVLSQPGHPHDYFPHRFHVCRRLTAQPVQDFARL